MHLGCAASGELPKPPAGTASPAGKPPRPAQRKLGAPAAAPVNGDGGDGGDGGGGEGGVAGGDGVEGAEDGLNFSDHSYKCIIFKLGAYSDSMAVLISAAGISRALSP
jgi:hypothetical protein